MSENVGRWGPVFGGLRLEQQGSIIFAADQPASIDLRITDGSQDELLQRMEDESAFTPSYLPPRPDFGTIGTDIKLRTNCFPISVSNDVIYEHQMDISSGSGYIPISLKRRILQLAEKSSDWSQSGLEGSVAYDNRFRRLVSTKRIPEYLNIVVTLGAEDKSRVCVLTLIFIKELNTSDLQRFLSGKLDRYYDPLPIISAFNLILSAHAKSAGLSLWKKYFFGNAILPISLGARPGPEAWKGFNPTVKPTWKQLMVNVNICNAVLHTPGNLAQAMDTFQRSEPDFSHHLETLVRQVRVKTTHLGQEKTVKRLATFSARQHMFDNVGYGKVPLEVYFKKKYSITIRYPQLQLVEIGGHMANYLPPELCEILPDQLYRGKLTYEQCVEMNEQSAEPPSIVAETIVTQGLQALGYATTADPLGAFGVTVGKEMAVVPGRILPTPGIHYGQGTPNIDEKASWNLRNVKFAKGGELKDWGVLLIQDEEWGQFSGVADPQMKATVKAFSDMCRTSGMRVDQKEPIYAAAALPRGIIGDPFRQEAIEVIRKTLTNEFATKKPTILLVLLPSADRNIYNGLKYLCDVRLKFLTVCVQVRKFKACSPEYFASVTLKMNMKLMGINHRLIDVPGSPSMIDWLKDVNQPTMFVGIDTVHPGPASVRGTPSIAAVVASIDDEFAQYPVSLGIQQSGFEIIQNIGDMVQKRLDAYRKSSNVLPNRIIVYRSGISEAQFNFVLELELPEMKKAFQEYGSARHPYNPKVAIIMIGGRRHRTKFFPTEAASSDQHGNPRPGTVVDRGVTSIYDFDFFLQSHYCMQGTARPTHYYVIHDEIGFGADEIQGVTNALSYMFARVTRAVSLPAPAYYAKLACKRGMSYLHSLEAHDSDDWEERFVATYRDAEKLWQGGPGEGIKDTMFYL